VVATFIERGGQVEGTMWFCVVVVVGFWLFWVWLGFVFCLECFGGGFWLLGVFLTVSKIFPDF